MFNKLLFLRALVVVIVSSLILYALYVNIFTIVLNPVIDYDRKYDETIHMLCSTVDHIESKRYGYDIDYQKIVELNDFYSKEYSRLLSTPGVEYKLIKTVEAYRNITLVLKDLYDLTMDVPAIWSGIAETGKLLEEYRIDDAVSKYSDMDFRIRVVQSRMKRAEEILLDTYRSGYLRRKDLEIVGKALSVLNETSRIISEYVKLMNLIIDYQESVEKDRAKARELAERISSEVDIGVLEPIYKNVANFISKLLTYSETGSNPSSAGPSGSGSGGVGGGYSSYD